MTTKLEKAKKLYKNPWINNSIWLIIFFIIYLLIRPFMQGDVVKDQAPNFNATTLAGEEIILYDLLDKPVLLHFWASWCPICEFSHPGIEKLSKDYQVLTIATQSDPQELEDYLNKHQLDRTNIVADFDGSIFRAYGAKAVPADFIINTQGEVAFVEVGLSSSWGMRFRMWWTSKWG